VAAYEGKDDMGDGDVEDGGDEEGYEETLGKCQRV
jgi:hypothetical protein